MGAISGPASQLRPVFEWLPSSPLSLLNGLIPGREISSLVAALQPYEGAREPGDQAVDFQSEVPLCWHCKVRCHNRMLPMEVQATAGEADR